METALVDNNRIRQINNAPPTDGPVVYWMSRDQRVYDNWALLYAQKLALEHQTSLIIIFNLVPEFLGATLRQYDFMLRGLQEIEDKCRHLKIRFHLLVGNPAETIPAFININ
ncbi:MAG: deoxyribodipyrimidine photo-lyase, partial [Candidatus Marinimicrobia bacterium]|nr:deoxyribodipyrimidine photo-lyase [Candidatus Neomarinimicrobiota bacterium]